MPKLGIRKHLLLTKELKNSLPKLYSTESIPTEEKRVVVKFFNPYGRGTWYVVEGGELPNGDIRFFGLVDMFELEWGYFVLSELEEASIKIFGTTLPAIERDKYFKKNTKIKDIPRLIERTKIRT